MKLPIIKSIVCVILLLIVPIIYFISKNSTSADSEYFEYIIQASGNVSNESTSSSTLEGELYINTSQQWSNDMFSQTGIYCQGILQLTQTPDKKKKKKKEKEITETFYITSVIASVGTDVSYNISMSDPETGDTLDGVLLTLNRDLKYVTLHIPSDQDSNETLTIPLVDEQAIAMKIASGSNFYSGEYVRLPFSNGKEFRNYVAKFYGDSSSIWIPLGLYICLITAIYLLLSGMVTAFFVIILGIALCVVTTFMSWTVAVPFIAPFILLCIMLPFRFLRKYLMYVCLTAFVINCLLCIVLFWNQYSFFTFIWKCAYIGVISMASTSFVGFFFLNLICSNCGRFLGSKVFRTNWVYDNAREILNADYTRSSQITKPISASNENGRNVCYWCNTEKDIFK